MGTVLSISPRDRKLVAFSETNRPSTGFMVPASGYGTTSSSTSTTYTDSLKGLVNNHHKHGYIQNNHNHHNHPMLEELGSNGSSLGSNGTSSSGGGPPGSALKTKSSLFMNALNFGKHFTASRKAHKANKQLQAQQHLAAQAFLQQQQNQQISHQNHHGGGFGYETLVTAQQQSHQLPVTRLQLEPIQHHIHQQHNHPVISNLVVENNNKNKSQPDQDQVQDGSAGSRNGSVSGGSGLQKSISCYNLKSGTNPLTSMDTVKGLGSGQDQEAGQEGHNKENAAPQQQLQLPLITIANEKSSLLNNHHIHQHHPPPPPLPPKPTTILLSKNSIRPATAGVLQTSAQQNQTAGGVVLSKSGSQISPTGQTTTHRKTVIQVRLHFTEIQDLELTL